MTSRTISVVILLFVSKKINYEEELNLLDKKIEKYKSLINEANEQRKKILEQEKQSKIQELLNCIEASGKTIEDVILQISA